MSEEMLPILREVAQAPGLLKTIYGDLAKPGVKQVGKALSTVLGLGNTLLWPLTLLNEKAKIALERNLEKYRAQLETVPDDTIATVPPEIGVPVNEKLSYVSDDELSDMYVNLLAKASTVNTASNAHPSFVNVINNLSPDEAILLKVILGRGALPFLTAKLVKKGENEWLTVGDLLTGLERTVKLSFPGNLVAYFSNFEGLGLIQVRRDIFIANLPLYEDLEKFYRTGIGEIASNMQTHELQFARCKIEITPYGQLFMEACLRKLRDA